jgi:hypothetical protein
MKTNLWRGLSLSALALLFAIPATAGELKLSIDSGRVTIIATDVPVAQVLQEWARVGHTKIVNAERVSGPAITVQLVNVPEKEALDIILRSASGYVAAPRAQLVANVSQYDRIMVMPTSIAPPPAPVSTAAAAPPPYRAQMPTPIDDDDEPVLVNVPPPAAAMPTQQPSSPFAAYPGAQPQQQQQASPQGAPAPYLSPTPGVVVGAPANAQPGQPGQPPNPYVPSVVKPGGGGGGGA